MAGLTLPYSLEPPADDLQPRAQLPSQGRPQEQEKKKKCPWLKPLCFGASAAVNATPRCQSPALVLVVWTLRFGGGSILPVLQVRQIRPSLRNSWYPTLQCLHGAAKGKLSMCHMAQVGPRSICGPCHLKNPRDQTKWKQEEEGRGSWVTALSAPVAAP